LDEIIYKTNSCNRLKEHYKDNINIRWEIHDPEDDGNRFDAPSKWHFA